MKPKMSYPLLVGPSDVVIHIAAKLFRSTGVGTKVELAFVDKEDHRIASSQFTFSQMISAEASILWIQERVPGQAGSTDKNGNRNGCDEN